MQKLRDAIDSLKSRIFYVRTAGQQHHYWDLDTQQEILYSHVLSLLIDAGLTLDEAKEAGKHLHTDLLPLTSKEVYLPNQPRVVKISSLYCENTWRKSSVEARDVDPSPFLDHLLLALGSQDKVDYLLDLMAFKYQNTNPKKPHAVVYLFHAEGGNGKSLFAETIRQVFGVSAVNIASERKLSSGSKVQLWKRTWLIAEEANVQRGSEIYDIIKTYSGQDEIEDDVKHAHFASHKIPANLIMLSNRPPSFLEPHDRRFFVSEWRINLEGEEKKKYFDNYVRWLDEGGYSAIAHLLATRKVDVKAMYAPVPVTPEKLAAMSVGQDACVREIKDVLEDEQKYRLFSEAHLNELWHSPKPVDTFHSAA